MSTNAWQEDPIGVLKRSVKYEIKMIAYMWNKGIVFSSPVCYLRWW